MHSLLVTCPCQLPVPAVHQVQHEHTVGIIQPHRHRGAISVRPNGPRISISFMFSKAMLYAITNAHY